MQNITSKKHTLRKALAQAVVRVGDPNTILAIKDRKVPKGDVLEMAKTAGLFAAKRTSDMIPDCHPLPIEHTQISFEIDGLEIKILAEISTVYKTGVEVEAMHAASVVALTMYDMLKPIEKDITIEQIKLLHKKGGKSDFNNSRVSGLKAAVIVCSDTISKGFKQDGAGKAIIQKLKDCQVEVADYVVIPDELDIIQQKVKQYCTDKLNLVVLTGGTGLSKRDVTPEAIVPLLDKRVPGIEETIRTYGQSRTPYAMLSRSVAGFIGGTLVLGLPGSTRGAEESMDAIFPEVLHTFMVVRGNRHD